MSVKKTSAKTKKRIRRDNADFWELRLYIAGASPHSLTALSNLKKFCEDNLKGKYRIEVVDLVENPQLASGDQILAIPTLVRKLPPPMKKIIGDLSNKLGIFVGLDLKPVQGTAAQVRR